MLHDECCDLIRIQSSDSDFLYPSYTKNCISNISGTLLDLFDIKNSKPKLPKVEIDTNDGVNKIVLFILDGFGFNQFLRYYKHYKFLADLTKKGDVFPQEEVKDSLKLLLELKLAGMKVSQAVLSEDDLVVYLTRTPAKVFLSLETDPKDQVSSLQLILDRAKMESKVFKKIDLRFENPIVTFYE